MGKPQTWFNFIVTSSEEKTVLGTPNWAFRGQGDAKWGLETSLGRTAHYGADEDLEKGMWLRRFEEETMWEFKREASKRYEYRGFEGIDLLSLVQHYGGKTRLLDFSLAPLLALFMAVEQNEADFVKVQGYSGMNQIAKQKLRRPDFAVWAVDLLRVSSKTVGETSNEGRTAKTMLSSAEHTIKNGNEEKGICIVFPKTCNQRISAQEGLFLMPKSLGINFESNLRTELLRLYGQEKVFHPKCLSEYNHEFMERTPDSPAIIKFVFPEMLLESAKRLLLEANVTAKNVYPDLSGLGRYVSSIVERHCYTVR